MERDIVRVYDQARIIWIWQQYELRYCDWTITTVSYPSWNPFVWLENFLLWLTPVASREATLAEREYL